MVLYLKTVMGTMQVTDYVRSLRKFIHMLSMIRTGTTLILGHAIKGQGHLWYFVKPYWPETDLVFMRGMNGSMGRLLFVI